jgi:predicted AlkP superfamily phosphohydrolase/phosphomutase
MKSGPNRVLIIGLDGATLDLISPWVAQGELPTFERLMSEGTYGELESVPNMHTAAAWPSMFTGKNPGKHGMFWLVEPKENSYDFAFVDGSWCRSPAIWDVLGQNGFEVGVFGVPMTFPAHPLNGFLVAGFDAPGPEHPRFAYPQTIVSELRQEFGVFPLRSSAPVLAQQGKVGQALDELCRHTERQVQMIEWLMKEKPWDLFMAVLMASDEAQHIFWHIHDPTHPWHQTWMKEKYGDPILAVYKMLDDSLARLRQVAGEDCTVLIVSDHGTGFNRGGTGQMNLWLEANGFLAFKDVTFRSRIAQVGRTWSLNAVRATAKLVRSVLGENIVAKLKAGIPNATGRLEFQTVLGSIDWSRTRVFCDEATHCLRVNLIGRQPGGIVEPGEEYEKLCDEVIGTLRRCRNVNTGKLAAARVWKREEAYWGPYVDRAPDIEFEWRADDGIIELVVGNQKRHSIKSVSEKVSGGHRINGIFIAHGPPVRAGCQITDAMIYDIAPTALCLMGLPRFDGMDGKVLEDAFYAEFLENHSVDMDLRVGDLPPQEVQSLSDLERKEIEDRLRALGYLA